MVSFDVFRLNIFEMANSKQNTARFMWQKDDKIENLISCMLEYNAEMGFNANGFNADKDKFYEVASNT